MNKNKYNVEKTTTGISIFVKEVNDDIYDVTPKWFYRIEVYDLDTLHHLAETLSFPERTVKKADKILREIISSLPF